MTYLLDPFGSVRRSIMGLRCKRCGSEEQVKNGLMRSKQRYLCKACGLNFTDTPAASRWPCEGHRGSVVCQRLIDEPHGQVAGRLDTHDPGLARAVRGRLRAEARAGGPGGGDRARRDVARPEKSQSPSGSGRLGIVLQGSWWTGNAAVVTRPPASASSSA